MEGTALSRLSPLFLQGQGRLIYLSIVSVVYPVLHSLHNLIRSTPRCAAPFCEVIDAYHWSPAAQAYRPGCAPPGSCAWATSALRPEPRCSERVFYCARRGRILERSCSAALYKGVSGSCTMQKRSTKNCENALQCDCVWRCETLFAL